MKHERSSNFELLRLLCIFGILVMHTFAGIDTAASPGNMLANVFANSLFNTGVTCFILLSGYFGIRFDLKKLIGLDLMVIFFTVVGTVALGDFGVKDLIKSCIPVLSRRYWFITCYFVLCILAPFLNQMAERLEREHFRRLLLLLLLVFSLIPTVTTYDVMQDAGKGLAHFVMIYLLGRYLARYHTGHCSKKQLLLGITGSTALIFCADGALTLHQGVIYSTFSRDCSIFIIFTAVLLLLLFRGVLAAEPDHQPRGDQCARHLRAGSGHPQPAGTLSGSECIFRPVVSVLCCLRLCAPRHAACRSLQ